MQTNGAVPPVVAGGSVAAKSSFETRQEEEGLKMVERFCELLGSSIHLYDVSSPRHKQTVTTEQLIGWIWLWAAI